MKEFESSGYNGREVVLVSNGNDGYTALTGSHRVMAARAAGIDVPSVVIPMSEEIQPLLDAADDAERAQIADELFENGVIPRKIRDLISREEVLNYENFDKPLGEQARFSEKDTEQRAVSAFGTTYSWNERGYLTPSGKQLDFSGKRDGAQAGYRSMDHRDISELYDAEGISGTDAMIKFMGEGNIRISPESGGINLQTMPTKAQFDKLQSFVRKNDGEVTIDFDDSNGNTLHSIEYPQGTGSVRINNDIRRYYNEGTVPEISETQRFRLSKKDPEAKSIKEQIREHASELNAMDVVGEYSIERIQGLSKGEIKQEVHKAFGSNFSIDKRGYGTVVFGKNQISSGINHLNISQHPEEVAAIFVVPNVVRNGIKVGSDSNHDGVKQKTVTFAAPVTMKHNGKGSRVNVGVVAIEERRNYYHAHRVLMPDGSVIQLNKIAETPVAVASAEVADVVARTVSATDKIARNPSDVKRFSRKDDVSVTPEDAKKLQKQNDKLTQALDLVRQELKITQGHHVKPAVIDRLAGRILKDYQSTMPKAELVESITQLFDYIGNGERVIWDEVQAGAMNIALNVLDKSTQRNTEWYDATKPARDYLKDTAIKLNDKQLEEVGYAFGSYNDFRRALFGKATVSRVDGIPLEQAWRDLSGMFPDVFDPDTADVDMPVMLYNEVLGMYDRPIENPYGYDLRGYASDLAMQLYDAYMSAPEVNTFADKQQKKLDLTKAH